MLVVGVVGLAVGCAGSGPEATHHRFGGTAWQLVRFQGGHGAVLVPDDRAKYTITFTADGYLSVRFDCNRGRGRWISPAPGQIEFGPLALTRAACPPGSPQFLSLLADGGTYEFETH